MHAELGRIAERGDSVDLEAVPMPENGDEVTYPAVPVRLTVEHMEGRRIDRIVLTRAPDADGTGAGSSNEGRS